MRKSILFLSLTLILAGVLLAACGKSSAGDPAKAVEAYWQALVAKDSAALSSQSCADFEQEALNTMESFNAVSVTLNDLVCTTSSTEGDTATVDCTGTIVASYGTENLTLNLADHSYSVVNEGGDWRMCGAK